MSTRNIVVFSTIAGLALAAAILFGFRGKFIKH